MWNKTLAGGFVAALIAIVVTSILSACCTTPPDPPEELPTRDPEQIVDIGDKPQPTADLEPNLELRSDNPEAECREVRQGLPKPQAYTCVSVKFVTNAYPRQTTGNSGSLQEIFSNTPTGRGRVLDAKPAALSYGEVDMLVLKRRVARNYQLQSLPSTDEFERDYTETEPLFSKLTDPIRLNNRQRGSNNSKPFELTQVEAWNDSSADCRRKAFIGDSADCYGLPADWTSIRDDADLNNRSVFLIVPGMGATFDYSMAIAAQVSSDIRMLRSLNRSNEDVVVSEWSARCGNECFDLGSPVVFHWRTHERWDPLSYHGDLKLIEQDATGKALATFLSDLIDALAVDEGEPVRRINILAHSLGNTVLVAEWELFANKLIALGNRAPEVTIIHGASELKVEDFASAMRRLPKPVPFRQAIYSSNDDMNMVLAKLVDGELESWAEAVRIVALASSGAIAASKLPALQAQLRRGNWKEVCKITGVIWAETVDINLTPQQRVERRAPPHPCELRTDLTSMFAAAQVISGDCALNIRPPGIDPLIFDAACEFMTFSKFFLDTAGNAERPTMRELIGLSDFIDPDCRLGDLTEHHCVDRGDGVFGLFNKAGELLLDTTPDWDVDNPIFEGMLIVDGSGRTMIEPSLLVNRAHINQDNNFFERWAAAGGEAAAAAAVGTRRVIADHDAVVRKPTVLTDISCEFDRVDLDYRSLSAKRWDSEHQAKPIQRINPGKIATRCDASEFTLYYELSDFSLYWPYKIPDPDAPLDRIRTNEEVKRVLGALADVFEGPNGIDHEFFCEQAWVLVMGSASEEGERIRNFERAALRTDLAAEIVVRASKVSAAREGCSEPIIFKLNLGQVICSSGECPIDAEGVDTADQRRIQILAREKDDGTKLSVRRTRREVREFLKENLGLFDAEGFDTDRLEERAELVE